MAKIAKQTYVRGSAMLEGDLIWVTIRRDGGFFDKSVERVDHNSLDSRLRAAKSALALSRGDSTLARNVAELEAATADIAMLKQQLGMA